MAEKSSELDKLNTTNTASTAAGAKRNAALQTRAEDNALAETETLDVESGTDDTEQIRDQIEETRRGMSETIDAIQEKLSISNISEQVKDQVSEQFGSAVESVKHAAIEKAGDFMQVINKGIKEIGESDVAKIAKRNPWVLSLVGLGIGALLVNGLTTGKRKRSSYRYNNHDFDEDDDIRYTNNYRRGLKSGKSEESAFQATRDKVGGVASSAFDTVSSAAGTAYEGVSDAASTAYEGVSNVAGTAYEGIGSAASKTYQGVGNAAGFAYEKAGDLGGQVKENYDYYIEENPLAVGAIALAVGAALGFAIPLTEAENEYMGEMRDNFFEQAQATAQDAIGTVKQMADEAQKTIIEEVKNKVEEVKNQTA